jgi:antitoxin HicB
MDIRYPAIIEQQDTGYFVQFVDLPDAFTEGATLEEALFNSAEALSAMLDWHLDQGHSLPEPSTGLKDAHYIAPDAKTQAALLVRRARGSRPLSEVARAMQTSWPAAQRLEDPSHSPSLKQLERAAAALGKRLVLVFE